MEQPNIIVFCGEDTGRHQGCYGDPYARTPNIDRLAREGCRFTNAFSTSPVSAPSRSCMVTGQYATTMGSHHMRSTLVSPPRLYTQGLRDGGYFVNWANKTDFNFEPPESFRDEQSEWITELEQGKIPGEDRPEPGGKPFFAFFNFSDTHESSLWPIRDWRAHKDGAQEEPGMDAGRFAGLPIPPYVPDSDTTRCALVRYYDALEKQDALLGRLLDALDARGLTDRTVVIYMTDHGRGLIREKRWLYEAGIHLPLIVRGPARFTGFEPGAVREDLVSWVDLAPTLSALAGLAIPERYQGRVFLGPNTQPEPACIFAARDRMDECFDRVRAARDRRYLYLRNDYPQIPWAQRLRYMEVGPVTRETRELHAKGDLPYPMSLWMQPTKPAEELYDTVADPHCVNNLAEREDLLPVLLRLRHAVTDWSERTDDLGFTDERELIARGVVTDRLTDEYMVREGRLPDHLRAGGVYDTVPCLAPNANS